MKKVWPRASKHPPQWPTDLATNDSSPVKRHGRTFSKSFRSFRAGHLGKQDHGHTTQFYVLSGDVSTTATDLNSPGGQLAPPVEWFSSTQWGVALVDHNETETEWVHEGGSGTQFTVPPLYECAVNAKAITSAPSETSPPTSFFGISTTTYLFWDDTSLGEQSFFAQLRHNQYLLPACPNFSPDDCPSGGGACGAPGASACPRRPIREGDYKLSVLGLLSGTSINSLGPGMGTVPVGYRGYRDIAHYKSIPTAAPNLPRAA